SSCRNWFYEERFSDIETKSVHSRHLYHSKKEAAIMLSFTYLLPGNRAEFVAHSALQIAITASRVLKEISRSSTGHWQPLFQNRQRHSNGHLVCVMASTLIYELPRPIELRLTTQDMLIGVRRPGVRRSKEQTAIARPKGIVRAGEQRA